MALPDFKNEDDFRQNWIKPFLRKLGYILVTHSHGPDEHGKDLFFADFDRFEHPRFCAVQAKKDDIGAGDIELLKLQGQIQACFDVRIRDRKGAEEQRISAVYVMASGTISSASRTRLCGHFRNERYGENVYFLDGDRLELLDKYAAFQTDQDARSTIAALLRETDFNLRRLKTLVPMFQKPRQAVISHLRISAVERAMATTMPPDLLPVEQIEWTWTLLEVVNGTIDFIQLERTASRSPEVEGVVMASQTQCETFRAHLLEAQRKLDERYNLQIEVV